MQDKGFKWRTFISFGMFFSFLIMAITGLILYIAPPGRVFRWTDWHFMFIDLSGWQALHTLFSYLFIGLAISHIFSMNWKVLISYFTRKTSEGLKRKKELFFSSLLIVILIAGTLINVQPFKVVMDVGHKASAFWGKTIDYPPVAHIEKMNLTEIASKILNITFDEYQVRIEAAGYKFTSHDQTLEQAAKQNRIPPYRFFRNTTNGLDVLTLPKSKDQDY
jgi:hypothetical protein